LQLVVADAYRQLENYGDPVGREEFRRKIEKAVEKGKATGEWYANYDKKTGNVVYPESPRKTGSDDDNCAGSLSPVRR
jgi:hypothetical protein